MSRIKEMKEVLLGIYNYLNKLEKGIEDIIERYQDGDEGQANRMMVEVIDSMGWIIEGINSTGEIQKEEIEVDKINEHLKEIIMAFENRDYVLLGDLLEYEINPIIDDWKKKIKPIIEE
ncbi:hypothetical protein [Dethiothermospora halolimnae]|uniref:hypothetical protein n=1 Tax=Dethiothermospora halolimnae TaxID=3114390 RepID=UPI003CCC033C